MILDNIKEQCPQCKSRKTRKSVNGFSIYPELGKPAYMCLNCRALFGYIDE